MAIANKVCINCSLKQTRIYYVEFKQQRMTAYLLQMTCLWNVTWTFEKYAWIMRSARRLVVVNIFGKAF